MQSSKRNIMNNLTVGDTWEWALYLPNKADCAVAGRPQSVWKDLVWARYSSWRRCHCGCKIRGSMFKVIPPLLSPLLAGAFGRSRMLWGCERLGGRDTAANCDKTTVSGMNVTKIAILAQSCPHNSGKSRCFGLC